MLGGTMTLHVKFVDILENLRRKKSKQINDPIKDT